MFSNNMLKKRSYNANAQITCRKHTATAATELLCSSCRKHKAIDFFSKNERKASGSQRCRACVEWVESVDPAFIPLAAPNSVRDEEEKAPYKGDAEDGAGFYGDVDDGYVSESLSGAFSNPWMGRSRETTGAGRDAGLTANNLQYLTGSGTAYSASSRGGGSYHASSAPTDSASTAGTENTARPRDTPQFNAYGPEGQFQKRNVSIASSVTSGTSRSTAGSKGWARPAGRKMPPALPRHLEYENPDTVGYCAYDDDDSSDGC